MFTKTPDGMDVIALLLRYTSERSDMFAKASEGIIVISLEVRSLRRERPDDHGDHGAKTAHKGMPNTIIHRQELGIL